MPKVNNVEAIFDRLEASDRHLERMASYANERFQRFPNITSITVDIGVAFGVNFQVMVTWGRPRRDEYGQDPTSID